MHAAVYKRGNITSQTFSNKLILSVLEIYHEVLIIVLFESTFSENILHKIF